MMNGTTDGSKKPLTPTQNGKSKAPYLPSGFGPSTAAVTTSTSPPTPPTFDTALSAAVKERGTVPFEVYALTCYLSALNHTNTYQPRARILDRNTAMEQDRPYFDFSHLPKTRVLRKILEAITDEELANLTVWPAIATLQVEVFAEVRLVLSALMLQASDSIKANLKDETNSKNATNPKDFLELFWPIFNSENWYPLLQNLNSDSYTNLRFCLYQALSVMADMTSHSPTGSQTVSGLFEHKVDNFKVGALEPIPENILNKKQKDQLEKIVTTHFLTPAKERVEKKQGLYSLEENLPTFQQVKDDLISSVQNAISTIPGEKSRREDFYESMQTIVAKLSKAKDLTQLLAALNPQSITDPALKTLLTDIFAKQSDIFHAINPAIQAMNIAKQFVEDANEMTAEIKQKLQAVFSVTASTPEKRILKKDKTLAEAKSAIVKELIHIAKFSFQTLCNQRKLIVDSAAITLTAEQQKQISPFFKLAVQKPNQGAEEIVKNANQLFASCSLTEALLLQISEPFFPEALRETLNSDFLSIALTYGAAYRAGDVDTLMAAVSPLLAKQATLRETVDAHLEAAGIPSRITRRFTNGV